MNAKDPAAATDERHAMSRDSLGAGGKLTWDFLTLFAQRRYAEANAYLAPGCQMLFPGGMAFTDCTHLPRRADALAEQAYSPL